MCSKTFSSATLCCFQRKSTKTREQTRLQARGSTYMLYPRSLHFLNLTVLVVDVFLLCFFFSTFLSDALGVVGMVCCPPSGKTVGTAPIRWRCSKSLLTCTFKISVPLMITSPHVNICWSLWLFTLLLVFLPLALPLPFQGLGSVWLLQVSSRNTYLKCTPR